MNSLTDEEVFANKLKNFLAPEDAYQFFLKIQFTIPKMAKQPVEKYYSFVSFSLSHLSKLKEAESAASLLDLALTNYIKNHEKPENNENFVEMFMKFFRCIPTKVDKTYFKCTFLEYCNKVGIPEELLYKNEVYSDFAKDSIDNEYLLQGYRFAIKAEKLELIYLVIEKVFTSNKFKITEKEQSFFVARTCLEFVSMKKEKFAREFIKKYLKSENDFNENPPVVNYAFLLANFFCSEESIKTVENFKKLNKFYEDIIMKEKTIKDYVNKIGHNSFKVSESGTSGLSFLNLLRAFTG